jgi:BolA protein
MRALLADLAAERLEIEDQSAAHAGHAGAAGGGGHYGLLLVSAAFHGLAPLQRHRLVYARLGELMPARIHALTMRLLTPEEARAGAAR